MLEQFDNGHFQTFVTKLIYLHNNVNITCILTSKNIDKIKK